MTLNNGTSPISITSLAIITFIIASLLPTAFSFLPLFFGPHYSDSAARSSVDIMSSNNNMRTPTTTALSSSTSPLCVAADARSLNLFSTTPLIHSIPLSKLCHPHPVYLKLDLLQQSGSFKDRGMAHLCATVHKVYNANLKQKQQQQQHSTSSTDDDNNNATPSRMKVISSSGGNAGLAVTTVARNIPEMDVSVVVPETTKSMVVEKLRSLGAEVTVFGKNWDEADGLARRWVEEAKEGDGDGGGGSAVYVSPFDNPLLWTGHSTVIDEIVTQMLELPSSSPPAPKKIGAVLASVGGGGLLCGIFEGIERNYFGGDAARSDVVRGTKVVACETEGAASFAASFNNHDNGKGKPSTVRLEVITSVATSLGALEVTPAVIQRANRHKDRGEMGDDGDDVMSYVCSDAEAVGACANFAKDHRMLVEPACGASLAPLYSERLRKKLLGELLEEGGGNEEEAEGCSASAIVVEVCGGSGVDLELLAGWKAQFLGDA